MEETSASQHSLLVFDHHYLTDITHTDSTAGDVCRKSDMALFTSTHYFSWLSILVLLGRKRKNGAIYFNHTLRIKWRDHRRNQSNYLIKEFFNMEKSRYLRIYDLHSWSGIVLGLLVFIV